jgi:hypothetical protein
MALLDAPPSCPEVWLSFCVGETSVMDPAVG